MRCDAVWSCKWIRNFGGILLRWGEDSSRKKGITSGNCEYTCHEELQMLMRNLCMCVCVCVCVHIYIYIYIYIYTHTCIYVYIYNHSSGKRFFYTPNRLGWLCGPPQCPIPWTLRLFPGKTRPARDKHSHPSTAYMPSWRRQWKRKLYLTYVICTYIYILLRHVWGIGVTTAEIIKERFQMYWSLSPCKVQKTKTGDVVSNYNTPELQLLLHLLRHS